MYTARQGGPLRSLLFSIASIAALGLMLWPTTGARAADPAPAPTPCNGVFLADAKGDELVPYPGPEVIRAGEDPNLDIQNVFLNYRPGADGKPVLTANFQVRELKDAKPEISAEGVSWVLEFDRLANIDWVRAVYDGAWKFQWGDIKGETGDLPELGNLWQSVPAATTGRVFPGKDGIIQIDFPANPEVKAGAKLPAAWAFTSVLPPSWDGYTNTYVVTDAAPEEGDKDYTVVDCPAGDPSAVPTPDATVTPPTTGTPQQTTPPTDQPQQQPPANNPQARQTVLPFKAAGSLGSAKKAARKRLISVRVSSTQTITNLFVQLKKGSKVIGTGRLSTLNGNGTLKLALRSKKLKAGKYLLAATGSVDGQSLTAGQTVRIAK
jgi:hypothetical protein